MEQGGKNIMEMILYMQYFAAGCLGFLFLIILIKMLGLDNLFEKIGGKK